MRTFAACMLTALMTGLAGCAAYDANDPHADSPGQPSQERGPTLCRDGTPPPCTIRE
jgi:hypothetical protein